MGCTDKRLRATRRGVRGVALQRGGICHKGFRIARNPERRCCKDNANRTGYSGHAHIAMRMFCKSCNSII